MAAAASQIRLPGSSDRTVVIGKTGSGKTQFAVWLLSTQDFHVRPWVVIDYKGDELINRIDKARDIDYSMVPTQPGIYILRVLPGEEDELSEWFKAVWSQENVGIYVDEGYMIGNRDKWYNACLTQGRSKHIPMIILTQRPLWLSRFSFSEASFMQIFGITDSDDRKTVKRYIEEDNRDLIDVKLPEFWSWYYDVGRDKMVKFQPVPQGDVILASIDKRLPEGARRKEL
jgi:hypothetical protein